MSSEERVARARALLGVPFRLHGRNPEHGLDCVGLVAFACSAEVGVPSGYALRNAEDARWMLLLDRLAKRKAGHPNVGDAVLCRAGPVQLHLGLWTGDSLIHADARIGHVVETPGEPGWPVIGVWQPD